MKKFAAALLMGLVLSASAEAQTVSAEPKTLHLDVGLLPGSSAYFYCDVKEPATKVTFLSHHLSVIGFNEDSVTFTENNVNVLNQVYFTANSGPFSGSMPSIDVVYMGATDDVVCYYGKGSRTVEFTGQ